MSGHRAARSHRGAWALGGIVLLAVMALLWVSAGREVAGHVLTGGEAVLVWLGLTIAAVLAPAALRARTVDPAAPTVTAPVVGAAASRPDQPVSGP